MHVAEALCRLYVCGGLEMRGLVVAWALGCFVLAKLLFGR